MKKLMIAAAAVALAGVTFADCDTPLDCTFAYRVKLAGKTVTGQTKTTGSTSTCDLDTKCWAKPTSLRIVGYIYGNTDKGEGDCAECECNKLDTNKAIFWYADTWVQTFADVDSVTFDVFDILRNGGLKNKAQIAFKLGDGLQFAGFGVYGSKSQMLKSANGFFAGTLDAPKCSGAYDASTCEYGDPETAYVFKPCVLEEGVEATAAIAYGRWSLTYRADKAAKYGKNGDEGVFKPLYFKSAESGSGSGEASL